LPTIVLCIMIEPGKEAKLTTSETALNGQLEYV
jgi:hypothetical protein